jgi:hypothetical protein
MANKDGISHCLSPSGNPRVDAVDRANERLRDEDVGAIHESPKLAALGHIGVLRIELRKGGGWAEIETATGARVHDLKPELLVVLARLLNDHAKELRETDRIQKK